jgi:hypothetical protein
MAMEGKRVMTSEEAKEEIKRIIPELLEDDDTGYMVIIWTGKGDTVEIKLMEYKSKAFSAVEEVSRVARATALLTINSVRKAMIAEGREETPPMRAVMELARIFGLAYSAEIHEQLKTAGNTDTDMLGWIKEQEDKDKRVGS